MEQQYQNGQVDYVIHNDGTLKDLFNNKLLQYTHIYKCKMVNNIK